MKILNAQLVGYNRRVDGSVSLRFNSLLEVSSKDIAEIDSHRNDAAVIALTDTVVGNEIDIKVDDILENLPENEVYDNHKTPSKRFRGVLWHCCKQELKREPTEIEFVDYYKREYEKITQHYKEKLDDII